MSLSVGDKAPEFSLSSAAGEQFTLSALLKKGALVLFFYPKDDTPGCTAEACSFRDSYDEFAEAGAQVVGISSDSSESHTQFASKHRLQMPLLSDPGGTARAAYGIKATLGLFPGRETFVIDQTGVIRHIFRSQLRVGKHVEEALAVIRKFPRTQG